MKLSTLLKAFSYLGLRGSRKIPDCNSICVFTQRRIQLLDISSTLWQPHHCTTRNRGACLPMGQASSFVRGYGGADEKATENSKEGIEKGLKGAGDSANASNDVNGSIESQVEQRASVDVEAERIPEAVVSPEEALTSQVDSNLGRDLASEGKEASKPAQTETVKTEVEDEAQTALNLALDELGEPPERPLPGDCCGQGCDVCVWDTYNDELRDYLARKNSLLKKSK